MDHTVGDLRMYVDRVAPVYGGYHLMTGFPPETLNDPDATVESAGLARSRIT